LNARRPETLYLPHVSPPRPAGFGSRYHRRIPSADSEHTMYVVTNRIPVAPGHELSFEHRFRSRDRSIEQEPGFLRMRVLKPDTRRFDHRSGAWHETGDRGFYLVQTEWTSAEAFWAWTGSESFRQAHADRPPPEMFAGKSALDTHETVMDLQARPLP
jgi:heme oxygenase (mycobilin-producing)